MTQPVKYAAHPVTLESGGAPELLDGTLSQRSDGKYTIHTPAGFLEVHGDGSYGYGSDENSFMAGAKYLGWNLLEYPCESDRDDGLLHATFLVAITTPVTP